VCFKKTEEKINIFLKYSKTKLCAYLANKTELKDKDISTDLDSDSASAEHGCIT